MKAVILAGGKGTRLRPYTTNFPKPLMPIGEKPILEIVIKQLKDNGVKDIIITVGHLAELIISYFKDGNDFGVNISYSRETEPLGTAGPLDLVKDQLEETFLLLNGDILTDIDFSDLINEHKQSHSIGTVAMSKREVNIDFGVIKSNSENQIIGWDEKPQLSYFVSMGIYVFNKRIFNYLPTSTFFNVPDLILSGRKDSEGVNTYHHQGFWLDIGREEDYAEACKVYEKIFEKK